MIPVNKQLVEDKLKKLKNSKNPFSITLSNQVGSTIVMYVITSDTVSNAECIKQLARWRSRANAWFPSQFKVTLEGTKKWAEEQLNQKPDRILFFLKKGNTHFGHIGLNRFSYENNRCEIDNIIRGKKLPGTKGAFTLAINELINWAHKELGFTVFTLSVFSDNEKAIRLYDRLGFIETKRIPLMAEVKSGVTTWREIDDIDTNNTCSRYFVTMQRTI